MAVQRARSSLLASLAAATLVSIVLIGPALPVRAAGHGEPGPVFPVRVELVHPDADLDTLHDLGIDIDGVFDGWARAYVTQEELDRLGGLGFATERLPDEGKIGLARMKDEGVAGPWSKSIPAQYHDYASLTADLAAIAAAHPDIVRLISIGRSVQDRDLWMLKISRNPDIDEDEPELAYVGAMHGDEVVGKELLINLAHELTDNYGVDPRLTALVDGAEIWLLPSMNPDGTALGQRYNANGYDLNRSFPDQFVDPVNTTEGRQPEVAAIMNWTAEHGIDLSANFHGGELVANYPFDGNPAGASVFSPTPDPDQPAFYSISRTYADNNPAMYANSSGGFDHGVTNGADWYAINGGMQDWRYVWHGGFEVTMEIGTKWPAASTLPDYWDDNFESMLSYLERGFEGLRGIVTDAETGLPLAAEIRLESDSFPVYTDPDVGDYHRIVLPGSYRVEVSAPGYVTRVFDGFAVASGPATRLDVSLEPVPGDLQPISGRVDDGVSGNHELDPGETAPVAVTVENLGRNVSAVSGTLRPTGWYVDVTRAEAAYPDIPMNGTAETLAPYHEVSVPADVPVGHKAGFYLDWTSAGGGGTTEAFFLDVGAPDCETIAASDLPQSVTFLSSALSQVVASPRQVSSVRVTVNVQHTYIGDLTMELTAPGGTSVLLHQRGGGSTDDIVGTYPDTLTPVESLDAFDGLAAGGTWSLSVTDAVLAYNGSLESWSLEVCGYPAEPTPELRFRELEASGGVVKLRWWEYPSLWSYRVYRSTDPSSAAAFADVTAEDGVDTDTRFVDTSSAPLVFYLVTGVGPLGEGPLGHFDQ